MDLKIMLLILLTIFVALEAKTLQRRKAGAKSRKKPTKCNPSKTAVAHGETTTETELTVDFDSKLIGYIDIEHSNKEVEVTLHGEGAGERTFTVTGFGKEFKPPVSATGVEFKLGTPSAGQTGQMIKVAVFGC